MMSKSTLASEVSKMSNTSVKDYDIYASVVDRMSNPGDLGDYREDSDFTHYGNEIRQNSDLGVDYLSVLVKKYGIIFEKVAVAKNPLAFLKKGLAPTAAEVQPIITSIIKQHRFKPNYRDPDTDEAFSPFDQNFPDVVSKKYELDQDVNTNVTFLDTRDTKYFQNLYQFHTFVFDRISKLVSGAISDEYDYTRDVLTGAMCQNKLVTYNMHYDPTMIDSDTTINSPYQKMQAKKELEQITLSDFANKVKNDSLDMTYWTDRYNTEGIVGATKSDDICVITSLKYGTKMDVKYLATLFNPENVENRNIKHVNISGFRSAYCYTKDHTVNQEDSDKGYLDVRSKTNRFGEYKIGDVIKAGTYFYKQDGVNNRGMGPDAKLMIDGDKIAAIIVDMDAVQIYDELPLNLGQIANIRGRYMNVYLNKESRFLFIQGLNAEAITISNLDEGYIKFKDPVANPTDDPIVPPSDNSGTSSGSDSSGTSSSGTSSGSSNSTSKK